MIGAESLLRSLTEVGVTKVFTLPGASSMVLHRALSDYEELDTISVLRDGDAVGLADGYWRVSGELAAVHLYEYVGFANAASNLYAALLDETPMLVIGTTSDRRQAHRMWSAEAPVEMAKSDLVKASLNVPTAERFPEYVRRAAILARSAPRGPVYLAVPADLYLEEVAAAPPPFVLPPLVGGPALSDSQISELVAPVVSELLENPSVVFVAGSELVSSGCVGLFHELASELSIPFFIEPWSRRFAGTPDLPVSFGDLLVNNPIYAQATSVVVFGSDFAKRFAFRDFDWVSCTQRLFHFTESNLGLGIYPAEVSAQVSLPALLQTILREVRSQRAPSAVANKRQGLVSQAEPAKSAGTLAALEAIADGIKGRGVRCFNDLVGLRGGAQAALGSASPENYYASRAGFMGAGLSIALGMCVAAPPMPTVCVVGDGTFVMAPQAMWVAARLELPLLTIVFNNRGWSCLRRYHNRIFDQALHNRELFCDLSEPAIDYVAMASSMGVRGELVTSVDDLSALLARFVADHSQPLLIELVLPSDE